MFFSLDITYTIYQFYIKNLLKIKSFEQIKFIYIYIYFENITYRIY